jgi:hypothetical protein
MSTNCIEQLQRRGLFRTKYEGVTLRENLEECLTSGFIFWCQRSFIECLVAS